MIFMPFLIIDICPIVIEPESFILQSSFLNLDVKLWHKS